jgi:tRNA-splicing ligase RtcB (3'-phosphate/5'-hydroxy nucleic acid ligase)
MVDIQDLIKINDYIWEIPKTYRSDMKVPVRLFITRQLLEEATRDASLDQAVNAATLPGLVGRVLVMPDMHQGYGFPIGGVAATRFPDGVISPGGIGYDINCGVRLLASNISAETAASRLDELANALNKHCPSGVGVKGAVRISEAELDKVCKEGARWALKKALLRKTTCAGRKNRAVLKGPIQPR